jgi:hypothetical protein
MATKRSSGASGNDEKRTKKEAKPAENPKGSASAKPKAAAKSSTAKASTKKASTAKAESPRIEATSTRRTTRASSSKASASKPSAKPARESKVACECSSHKAEATPAPAQSHPSNGGHDHVPARRPEPVRRAAKKSDTPRTMAVVARIAVAFIASYNFASAASGGGAGAGAGSALAAIGADAAALAGGAGGGCCGGGGAPIEKQTDVQGDVQTIAVDTSSGSYDPNVIIAKAGVPIEIAFSQSSGCLYSVQFPDFGVYEDLQDGPKTIKLPALEPGEYQWACGMNMATGTLRVE